MDNSYLQQFAKDVWLAERPFSLFKAEFGLRMTVVRLDDGSLVLHSPIPWHDELRAALEGLGTVAYLVVPNRQHNLFVDQWQQAYPRALTVAVEGVAKVKCDAVLGRAGEAPGQWGTVLTHRLIQGIPLLNEAVFLHAPSRTLILTDLAFNIPASKNGWSGLFFRMNGAHGRFTPSRALKLMVKDRAGFAESLRDVLAWDFDNIVISHGQVLRGEGTSRFRHAFEWAL